MKSLFGWCLRRKLISENPFAGEVFKRPAPKACPGLTLADIERVLGAAGDYHRPLYSTLAFTGMRSGELKQLRSQDVDFKGNWIHIVDRPEAHTKTGVSRKVPIHPRLLRILKKVRPGKTWFFTAPPSNRYPDGQHHYNPKKLNEDFLELLKGLGIEAGRGASGFTLHSLRHSFKTICVNAKIPRDAVDEWQGHVPDKRNASNVYYKLTDEASQQFMLEVPFGDGLESEA